MLRTEADPGRSVSGEKRRQVAPMESFVPNPFLPVALDNSEAGERARTLFDGIVLIALGVLAYGIVQVAAMGDWSRLDIRHAPIVLTILPLALASLELNRRGHRRTAAWLFILGYITLTSLRAPFSGGIRAPSVGLFPAMTIFAGMILGARAGLIVAVACSAIGLSFLLLEFAGLAPVTEVRYPPIVYWAALSLYTVVSLFLLRIALDRSKKALEAAQAELASRLAAERKLALALQAGAIGAFEGDLDAKFILADDLGSRLLGFDPAEGRLLSRMAIRERVEGESLGGLVDAFNDLKQGSPLRRLEYRIRHPDGQVRDIASSAAVYVDPQTGRRVQVGTLIDTTERKASEKALADSEARYRLLADHATDVILRLNMQQTIEYVSPSVRGLGFRQEELIGRTITDLIHPEDLVLVAGRQQVLLRGEPVGPLELRFRQSDGGWLWMESNPGVVRDEADEIIGWIATLRDIGQRKTAEAAVQAMTAELARVARMSALGVFAGSIAHETNQPLAAAALDGETAQRWMDAPEPNMDKARQALRRAVANVRRASDVISGLKSMVVKEQTSRSRFDLAESINDVLMLTQRRCVQAGVSLNLELEPVRVIADRTQIQQVVLNLVSNAIDAVGDQPEGTRLVLVRAAIMDDGQVMLSVEDRGSGIPANQASRIFDNLFTTKDGGTGLGLPISKSIVEAHGGRIWVESAKPKGAAFKVLLPIGDGTGMTL